MTRRKLLTMILAMVGTLLVHCQAFGYWVEQEAGWKYKQPDGTYLKDTWEWIDGDFDGYAELYYLDPNGYCLLNGTKDGRSVNADGAWTYKGTVQTWDLKNLTGWYRLNGDTMYLEGDGQIYREKITPDNIYVNNVGWKVLESGIDETEMAEKSADCVYIVINKTSHFLERWEKGTKTHSFVISSGASKGDKIQMGDMKTPEGEFYISRKVPYSSYHLALLINYPNLEDAERGLASGLITEREYNSIVYANQHGGAPNASTNLGGLIEIHGMRRSFDGSQGCIGMRNEDIDVLYAISKVGDHVWILP